MYKEEESWDDNIDKTVIGTTLILYGDQEGKNQENQVDQTNEHGGSSRSTHGDNAQMEDEQGESSSSQVSNDSNPILASLRSRIKKK